MVYSNVCGSGNTFKRVCSSSILNVLSLTAPNNRLLVCVKYFYVTYVFAVIQNHRDRIRTSRHPLGARRNNLRLSASSRFFQISWTISCCPVINQPFDYVPKKTSIPLETRNLSTTSLDSAFGSTFLPEETSFLRSRKVDVTECRSWTLLNSIRKQANKLWLGRAYGLTQLTPRERQEKNTRRGEGVPRGRRGLKVGQWVIGPPWVSPRLRNVTFPGFYVIVQSNDVTADHHAPPHQPWSAGNTGLEHGATSRAMPAFAPGGANLPSNGSPQNSYARNWKMSATGVAGFFARGTPTRHDDENESSFALTVLPVHLSFWILRDAIDSFWLEQVVVLIRE